MESIWVCDDHSRKNDKKIVIWSGQQCVFCKKHATYVRIVREKNYVRRFIN